MREKERNHNKSWKLAWAIELAQVKSTKPSKICYIGNVMSNANHVNWCSSNILKGKCVIQPNANHVTCCRPTAQKVKVSNVGRE